MIEFSGLIIHTWGQTAVTDTHCSPSTPHTQTLTNMSFTYIWHLTFLQCPWGIFKFPQHCANIAEGISLWTTCPWEHKGFVLMIAPISGVFSNLNKLQPPASAPHRHKAGDVSLWLGQNNTITDDQFLRRFFLDSIAANNTTISWWGLAELFIAVVSWLQIQWGGTFKKVSPQKPHWPSVEISKINSHTYSRAVGNPLA